MKKHELPSAFELYGSRPSGVGGGRAIRVDEINHAGGADEATQDIIVIAKMKSVPLVHHRRPTLLVDGEAAGVKNRLASNGPTDELTTGQVARVTTKLGRIWPLV
jgi:hypothetical protein